ncbi:hypothetical protein [Wenzhouxiangella marina]|uniref:Uncharacterized protein n=1 Tax=Wenzhouxiangella marina TaxID=1579979 RepID=A0A0K0XTZ0_9GAMM|nr:hypothetical protein [Wenzhouxiangella marina]AKS41091.1 hypothetical protein WM2015_710 [Wenzhouxiangella marina]MBB6087970.1 hypothetical protein [Wenzhouxiangella marina]
MSSTQQCKSIARVINAFNTAILTLAVAIFLLLGGNSYSLFFAVFGLAGLISQACFTTEKLTDVPPGTVRAILDGFIGLRFAITCLFTRTIP